MVGGQRRRRRGHLRQAGQNYAHSLLWVLLLVPVLIANQEMVVWLGAVTGVGHARLINERFGRFWGRFSVGDLFLLNFLTITTEFIGISLALAYFGVSKYITVPVAAAVLIAITTSESFRRWEAAMLLFIASSAMLFPLAFLAHPANGVTMRHLVVPGILAAGGLARLAEADAAWAGDGSLRARLRVVGRGRQRLPWPRRRGCHRAACHPLAAHRGRQRDAAQGQRAGRSRERPDRGPGGKLVDGLAGNQRGRGRVAADVAEQGHRKHRGRIVESGLPFQHAG